MKNKFILIMLIDHESTSEQIILKSLKTINKSKKKFLIIGDIKFFNFLRKKIYIVNSLNNIHTNKKIIFYNINSKKMSNYKFINKLTEIAISLLKSNIVKAIINMPLDKKKYFKNKFNGFTEFFSHKIKERNKENMLIYNNKLSVIPVTTHVRIKDVHKLLNSKNIIKAVKNCKNFYKKIVKKEINIKILGLNPHAGVDSSSNTEEKKIIYPAIKKLKIKNINGPVSPDTAFLNIKKNTCFIGMYHDQVLTIFKTLFNFEGINITIGLKYLRLSPDHGPGKNLTKLKKTYINNKSFLYCIKFCEKYIKT